MAHVHAPGRTEALVVTAIRGGSRLDPPDLEGLAHLVEHLWYETVPAPGSPAVTDVLAHLGAQADAQTLAGAWIFVTEVPEAALADVLTLEARRWDSPLEGLGPDVLAVERAVVDAEARERSVARALQAPVLAGLFAGTAADARLGAGDAQTLARATPADAAALARQWRPAEASLVIASPLPHALAWRRVAASLGLADEPAPCAAPSPLAPDVPTGAAAPARTTGAVPMASLAWGWIVPIASGDGLEGAVASRLTRPRTGDTCASFPWADAAVLICAGPDRPEGHALRRRLAHAAQRAARRAVPDPDAAFDAQAAARLAFGMIQPSASTGSVGNARAAWHDSLSVERLVLTHIDPGLAVEPPGPPPPPRSLPGGVPVAPTDYGPPPTDKIRARTSAYGPTTTITWRCPSPSDPTWTARASRSVWNTLRRSRGLAYRVPSVDVHGSITWNAQVAHAHVPAALAAWRDAIAATSTARDDAAAAACLEAVTVELMGSRSLLEPVLDGAGVRADWQVRDP